MIDEDASEVESKLKEESRLESVSVEEVDSEDVVYVLSLSSKDKVISGSMSMFSSSSL